MNISATTAVTLIVVLAAFVAGAQGTGGEGELPSLEEIDRQLNNPLSKTWALTLQDNIGIQDGDLVDGSTWNNLLFFQPLLPVPVSKSLMFSGRPVFPLVTSPNVDFSTGESDGHTTGLGDIQLMTLIGPDKADGWVWGAGATFKFPTASDPVNGQGKYQAGPAAMLINMGRPWVYGFLVQHWSSFAGDDQYDDTSFTDFQYIIRYMLPKAWSVGAGPSITYNHEAESGDRLTVPIGLGVTKTVRVGKLPMKLRGEVHYSVVRPESYGEAWNIRLQITPVIKSPFIK
ncbi:MAG: hypothetical protein OEV48_10610 [Acidobacteriota bacterium]|nr:hypothetical protein [Acidobacteriota bacterium]